MESLLILSRGGFPPLSARGCIQHLTPIETGRLRRTVNGKLIYTGNNVAHKYRSIITCEDKTAIAFEGFWRGSELRVGCIQRIWQKVSGHETKLERDPIPGSVFAMTSQQQEMEVQAINGRTVTFSTRILDDLFVSYRPWLDMLVVNFALMTNEWGLKVSWRLDLEEI
jgi:hypothetical protein